MQKVSLRHILALALVVAMLAGLSVPVSAEDSKTITILQTSDIHGMINPFDYASNKENSTSLAHAAAIIKAERAADPNLLLLDTGDTVQANYIQAFKDDVPNPAIGAFNYLGYDAWTLGNHEFNFDFKYTQKQINEFDGAVLAGNFYQGSSRWSDVEAYHIFDVDGVKVAVFGVDAPHIPQWEKSAPEHYNSMTITTPEEEIGKILDELEGKADVIVGSVHYGPDGEYNTTGMRDITEKYSDRIDAMFIGHAHSDINEEINGVPMLEPGSNCKYVSKVTLTVKADGDGWTVDSAKGELLSCADATPDPEFLAEFKSLHDRSLEMASKQVGTVGKTFIDPMEVLPGIPTAILEDDAVTDLVNIVQMKESGADVSLAALFDATSNLQAGPFLNRDSVKIYKYDNTLYGVKVTGKQLKAIMEEHAGNFFNQYQPGDVTISFNENIRMYNYDMFAGVNYEIDISKPAGSRIQNVTYKGEPLSDTQTLVLALNNYRYGGLVSAGLIRAEDVVYEGGAVRDMITDYVASLGAPLMPVVDNNWKIVGADLDDPQKDLIYDMVRSGEIDIPTSEDGRTPNIAALNGPALRAAGILPALEETAEPQAEPTPAPEPEPAPAPEPEPAPAPEPEPQPAPSPSTAEGTYVVKSGDCLWSISQKVYGTGTQWGVIYNANKAVIKNPSSISVGQVLVIPAA